MQMFPTDTSHLASADKVTLRKQLDRMRMDSDEYQIESDDGDKEEKDEGHIANEFRSSSWDENDDYSKSPEDLKV